MAYEVIYICNSLNNKNIREGELNILVKHENQLCFEFGSDSMNIKKRFYNDIETLNKDFENLLKLKEKQSKMEKKEKKGEDKKNPEEKKIEEDVAIEEKSDNSNEKNNIKLEKYKIIKRKK